MRCELLLTNLNSNLTAVSEYGKKITNQKKKTYIDEKSIPKVCNSPLYNQTMNE